ncbi:hypothetical protein BZB76_0454 [Actinomadura pelletieri DSM 43383]|uniref:Peptidase inhibitor family I36 n=1 Tax=Actinomadura pelletieri DSM 43383 TaxID=1120940 RepID=A0A495QYK8_9ACTN|nr:hypothetical protein [Actinomadura pelletieri]RKS79016.1 hypothetical protein BZB76_0454 [Actinomadura pelletieri DSM 43383]
MRSFTLLTATLSAATTLGLAAPPTAATGGQTPANDRHCVLHLTSGGTVSCYRTFTEAIADATGGQITNAPRNVAAAVADTEFDRRLNALGQSEHRAADLDAVISIEFEDANYGGRSNVIEADGVCDDNDDIEYSAPTLPEDWNDTITSFKTYVQCQVNHYQHPDYQGTRTGWLEDTPNIGSIMNDRTSSIQWR